MTRRGLCAAALVTAAACSSESELEPSDGAAPRADGGRDAGDARADTAAEARPADGSGDAGHPLEAAAQLDAGDAGTLRDGATDVGRGDAVDGDARWEAGRDGAANLDDAVARDATADQDAGRSNAEASADTNVPDGSTADRSVPESSSADTGVPESATPADASPTEAAADTSVGAPDVAVDSRPPVGEVRRLGIVAHPDDDVLFMNPDLDDAIQAGVVSRTVYLTSGDASDGDWRARETRILAAHAAMLSVPSAWTCGLATYAGQGVQLCSLQGVPRISAVFMRLRDGSLARLWARAVEPPFGVQPLPSDTTIDNTQTYTRDAVLGVLQAIMAEFAPTHTATLDSTLAYGTDEHNDHVASGMFALVAAQAHRQVGNFTIYRGYTTLNEPQNLTAAQYARKASIMTVYAPFAPGSQYDLWCQRQIAIPSQVGAAVALRQGTRCLGVSGAAVSGAAVVLTACSASPEPRWTVGADAHVRGPGGLCLAIRQNGTNAVELAACANTAAQKWLWSANGQLRGADASCLTSTDATVTVTHCGRDATNYGVPANQGWVP